MGNNQSKELSSQKRTSTKVPYKNLPSTILDPNSGQKQYSPKKGQSTKGTKYQDKLPSKATCIQINPSYAYTVALAESSRKVSEDPAINYKCTGKWTQHVFNQIGIDDNSTESDIRTAVISLEENAEEIIKRADAELKFYKRLAYRKTVLLKRLLYAKEEKARLVNKKLHVLAETKHFVNERRAVTEAIQNSVSILEKLIEDTDKSKNALRISEKERKDIDIKMARKSGGMQENPEALVNDILAKSTINPD